MIINLKKYKDHSYLSGVINILKKVFWSLNQPMTFIKLSKKTRINTYNNYPAYLFQPLSGEDLCNSCGVCVQNCPVNIITLEEMDDGFEGFAKKPPAQFFVNLSMCIKCGYCVLDCPENALSMDGAYKKECFNSEGLGVDLKILNKSDKN